MDSRAASYNTVSVLLIFFGMSRVKLSDYSSKKVLTLAML